MAALKKSGQKIPRRGHFGAEVSAWTFRRGRFGVDVLVRRFRRGGLGAVVSATSSCHVRERYNCPLWKGHMVLSAKDTLSFLEKTHRPLCERHIVLSVKDIMSSSEKRYGRVYFVLLRETVHHQISGKFPAKFPAVASAFSP